MTTRRAASSRSAEVLAYARTLDALCELDRTDRAALRLIYWHGLSQREVAVELAMSEDEIRRRVAHGLRIVADRVVAGEERPRTRKRPPGEPEGP